MGKLFGTDGVRGIANEELTGQLAFEVGKAGAYALAKESKHKPKILVGCDTRISCDMLLCALSAGILSAGGDVIRLGVIPTPAVAYLVRKYGADAGVMISASHNPMEYNGIKFFNGEGYKLSDQLEEEIEELIFRGLQDIPNPTGAELGRIFDQPDALFDYCSFLESTAFVRPEGISVLIDCANGATYRAGEAVLKNLGVRVEALSNHPDGTNINRQCGSTHMENLKKALQEGHYDLGLAFDGDGDRLLAMDAKGNLVDGDVILAIFAKYFKENGSLKGNTLVGTVMSNLGLRLMCEEQGIDFLMSKVGDRYVLEDMLKGGYVIGGEQSGHIILLDHNTTGDGIMSAVQLLCILKDTGKSLGELKKVMTVLPQVLVNVRVENQLKEAVMKDEQVMNQVRKIEESLGNQGRVLLRPSGTEPLIRVMIEGPCENSIRRDAQELAALVQQRTERMN